MNPPFPRKKWANQDWAQIRNLTKIKLISLLDKDKNWEFLVIKGARYIYRNPTYKPPFDHIAIHYHKEQFREERLLKDVLDHWCCTRDDFKRWKVIR